MSKFTNILGTIGNTPLVRINRLNDEDTSARLWAKVESFNPGGSAKDRIALSMVEKAEEDGLLDENSVLVEPTSGNTGVGLAMVAAVKGYPLILVMPDTMSMERRKLLRAFGAELLLTPGEKGMNGAVEKARELTAGNENYFMLQQFENLANPAIHYRKTAEEIIADLAEVDAFVAGVGTGGTVTGVGRRLKELKDTIDVVAVEPAASPVLSGGKPGPHKIQGIGAGFVPPVFDRSVIDDIITVEDEDALETTRLLAKEEGILAGISAGAAVFAALQVAKKLGPGKDVVVITLDTGERYLSVAGLF